MATLGAEGHCLEDGYLRHLTPEFPAHAEGLGLQVGTWQGAADNFLTGGDSTHWQKALDTGAKTFMTAHPSDLLRMLDR